MNPQNAEKAPEQARPEQEFRAQAEPHWQAAEEAQPRADDAAAYTAQQKAAAWAATIEQQREGAPRRRAIAAAAEASEAPIAGALAQQLKPSWKPARPDCQYLRYTIRFQ